MQPLNTLKRGWPGWVAALLLTAALALSACGGGETADTAPADAPAEQPAEAAEPTEAPTEEAAPTEAPTEEAAVEQPATAPEDEAVGALVGCEAIDIPDNETVPPVTADEWALGPEDAMLTLVEYGDFQ